MWQVVLFIPKGRVLGDAKVATNGALELHPRMEATSGYSASTRALLPTEVLKMITRVIRLEELKSEVQIENRAM